MIDLAELERLAKAATPVPWNKVFGVSPTAADKKDVDFIAAANPETVLELVNRLKTAEGLLEDAPEDDTPGYRWTKAYHRFRDRECDCSDCKAPE